MGFGNSNVKGPCKDCERRSVGCHATCEDYNFYRKHVDDARAKRLEQITNKYDKYLYRDVYKHAK